MYTDFRLSEILETTNEKEKTVNSQKTLDGQTAAFIAAVANALSRNISAERQQELIGSPDDLKRLLLPLVDDEWIHLSPTLLNGTLDELVWLDAFNDIQKRGSHVEYTTNRIIEIAKSRLFAFLDEGRAEHLCKLVCSDNPPSKYMSGRVHRFFFPFTRSKEVFAWVDYGRAPQLKKFGLNEKYNFSRALFFFEPASEGSMEIQHWK